MGTRCFKLHAQGPVCHASGAHTRSSHIILYSTSYRYIASQHALLRRRSLIRSWQGSKNHLVLAEHYHHAGVERSRYPRGKAHECPASAAEIAQRELLFLGRRAATDGRAGRSQREQTTPLEKGGWDKGQQISCNYLKLRTAPHHRETLSHVLIQAERGTTPRQLHTAKIKLPTGVKNEAAALKTRLPINTHLFVEHDAEVAPTDSCVGELHKVCPCQHGWLLASPHAPTLRDTK